MVVLEDVPALGSRVVKGKVNEPARAYAKEYGVLITSKGKKGPS